MPASAKRSRSISPVGRRAGEGARRRARSAEYRAERERLGPYEALARLAIKHRLEQNLTQRELAERMGTSHSAISRIESGQHPTSLRTIKRLAEALGLRLVVGFETDSAGTPTTLEVVTV